jgi:hypothetical protein
MLSTDFLDNCVKLRSLVLFTALTKRFFCVFSSLMANFLSLSVDKVSEEQFLLIKDLSSDPFHKARDHLSTNNYLIF